MITSLKTNSVLKISILLVYYLLIAMLSAFNAGEEIKPESLNHTTIIVLKLVQWLSVIIIFILPSIFFAIYFTNEKINYLRLNIKPKIKHLIFSTLIIIISMPLINAMKEINDKMLLPDFMMNIEQWMKMSEAKMKILTDAFLNDVTISGFVLNMIVVAFFAALSEEFFFRGIIQKTLLDYTKNIHLSVWLTGILFSAIHLQFYGFFPRMMIGVLLGYMFVWSGSLWVPILVHFVNNGTGVLLTFLIKKNLLLGEIENIGSGKNANILVTVCLVLFTGFIYFFYSNRTKEITDASINQETQAL